MRKSDERPPGAFLMNNNNTSDGAHAHGRERRGALPSLCVCVSQVHIRTSRHLCTAHSRIVSSWPKVSRVSHQKIGVWNSAHARCAAFALSLSCVTHSRLPRSL